MPENSPSEPALRDRRQFLAAVTQLPVLIAAASAVGNAQEPQQSVEAVLPPVPSDHIPAKEGGTSEVSNLHGTENLSALNLTSAHVVSVGFVGSLADAVLKRGGHISMRHAAVVNGLEAGRVAVLAAAGGEDREHARKELKDLIRDSLPALAMIAASDFAGRGISLEPSVIATRLRPGSRYQAVRGDLLAEERPSFEPSSLGAWQAHLGLVTDRINDHVAQMAAITSISAPVATTLTSAAFWKNGFDDVAHLCMELAFSRQVISALKNSLDVPEHMGELKERAAADATEMLNGRWGYNQLGIALACNAQGLFGIGTPPNLWFAFNHLARDPSGFASAEASGLIFSETQTLLGTATWLSKSTGLSFSESFQKLIASQYKMVGLIAESFSDAELRTASIGSGSKLIARLMPILHGVKWSDAPEDIVAAIQKEILKTPAPAFQLSLGKWLDHMGAVYERIMRRFPAVRDKIGDIPDLTAEQLDDIELLKGSEFYRSLEKAIQGDASGAVQGHFEKYQRWKQERLAQRIAVVLHSIAGDEGEQAEALDEFISGFGLAAEMQFAPETFRAIEDVDSRAVMAEIGILSRTMQQVTSFGTPDERLKASWRLHKEGAGTESILRQLGFVHRDTLDQAGAMLVNINDAPENIRDRLQRPVYGRKDPVGDDTPNAALSGTLSMKLVAWLQDSWNDGRNLSEATRDIIRVIATQLPAIPAFSISLSEVLKQVAGVDGNSKISHGQLAVMLKVLPVFGYGVAALADNVPGYLILQEVVTKLFEQTFGVAVVEQVPHLKTRIGFISKIIASQSGMALPFSSATNLLQDKIVIEPMNESDYPQGFGIEREKLSTADTARSIYMNLSSFATIGWAMTELEVLFRRVQHHEKLSNG